MGNLAPQLQYSSSPVSISPENLQYIPGCSRVGLTGPDLQWHSGPPHLLLFVYKPDGHPIQLIIGCFSVCRY